MRDFLFETAAVWSVAGKIIQAVAAPITAALILVSFTPTVQGYYYSFGSLLDVQNEYSAAVSKQHRSNVHQLSQ